MAQEHKDHPFVDTHYHERTGYCDAHWSGEAFEWCGNYDSKFDCRTLPLIYYCFEINMNMFQPWLLIILITKYPLNIVLIL